MLRRRRSIGSMDALGVCWGCFLGRSFGLITYGNPNRPEPQNQIKNTQTKSPKQHLHFTHNKPQVATASSTLAFSFHRRLEKGCDVQRVCDLTGGPWSYTSWFAHGKLKGSLGLHAIRTFNMFASKFALRHNGVQLFISHLPRWLRTRRFSEPTFRPSGATNHWKNKAFRDLFTFSPFRAPASSFFWLFLFFDLLSSFFWLFPPLLFHLSILSEVWLLNFLPFHIYIYILWTTHIYAIACILTYICR